MQVDPTLVQSAISAPVTFGLALYTLLRRDRSSLHIMLALLLSSVGLWLTGVTIKLTSTVLWVRELGLDLETGSAVFMPPLFLITMGCFARSATFEQSRAAAVALLSVSGMIFVGYLTDAGHHLYFADRASALNAEHPAKWAGPLFWAFQIWCVICDVGAMIYLGTSLRRANSRSERGRAWMVLAAVLAPIVTHIMFVFGLQPFDFSLAPGSLGLTAFFFVGGVHQYGLLEAQPIVRHDIIEHLDDALLVTDAEGILVDSNASAERALGTPRSVLRGQPLSDVLTLLHAETDLPGFDDGFRALPGTGGRISGELRCRDGRFIELTAVSVEARGHQSAGLFIALRDRSEQRRSERLLRERQKLESVGLLAAGVAHEVNNPLAFVRANLEHLRGVTEDFEKILATPEACGERIGEVLECPDIIAESIEGLDRIAGIVESMLRFSRVPDERMREIDIARVTSEALRLAALERDSKVRVECVQPESVPPVYGSPERIVQVLLNLFLNGKQALAEQDDACITAEIGVEGSDVVIRIRDNGPGISEEDQQKIFMPFFTTRAPDQGTGLGLSIAFDIVREHGGTLELDSTPGEGACFTIRLPIAVEASA